MKSFLLEMHAHTSDVSPCAHLDAENVVKQYINEGYDGIIITNHMSDAIFKNIPNASWKDKVEYYLTGYKNAKAFAGDSLTVLLGMEITFRGAHNDYLVYGLDEELLFEQEFIMDIGLKKLKVLAEKNNLLVFQAHPFRKGMLISDYRLLDGIEVYNGHSGHNSSNDIAIMWARKYGLRKLSGSDFHHFFGMRPGGMYFPRHIKTNAELIEALRNNNYILR